MTGNNSNLDLVKMNAYIKSGGIMSICSQDIERKQSSGVNQGQYLWYKYARKACQDQCIYKIRSFCSQDIERKRNCGVNQEP